MYAREEAAAAVSTTRFKMGGTGEVRCPEGNPVVDEGIRPDAAFLLPTAAGGGFRSARRARPLFVFRAVAILAALAGFGVLLVGIVGMGLGASGG
jgi:hypothetical protein